MTRIGYRLFHADAWDDHKYVARVPLPRKVGQKGNNYRYFYTREAYQAYLNGQKTTQVQSTQKFQNANVPKTMSPLTRATLQKGTVKTSENSTEQTSSEDKQQRLQTLAKRIFRTATSAAGVSTAGRDWLDNVKAYNESVTLAKAYKETADDMAKTEMANGVKAMFENVLNPSKFKEGLLTTVGWNIAKDYYNKDYELKKDNYERFMKNVDSDDPIASFNKLDSPGDPDEALSVINPNYDGDKNIDPDGDGHQGTFTWTNNCAYCTAAYDMRRRGYDVVADGVFEGDDLTYDPEMESWYDGAEYKYWQDVVKFDSNGETTYDDVTTSVEKELKSHGEGARGFFTVAWLNGGGHAVAWEVENGDVVIRDCQTGDTYDVEYYVHRANLNRPDGLGWFRTDNVEPNREIANVLRNREGG